MRIKEIEVKNFKSFDHLKLELGKFNVFVGPNAAGKSNLIEIFKFLKAVSTEGLDNAISMQGREYLSNITIGNATPIFVRVVINDDKFGRLFGDKFAMSMEETSYEFQISFTKTLAEFTIPQESMTCSGYVFKRELKNKRVNIKEKLGKYKYKILRDGNQLDLEVLDMPESVSIEKEDILPPYVLEAKDVKRKDLLLNFPFLRSPIRYAFNEIATYDLDPKLSKKAVPITGRAELEGNGENFAIILKSITEDKAKEKKLRGLIKDVLPFVSGIRTERFADKSLLFKLQETYFKKHDLLAPFISDGTINLIVIIVALYFEEKMVTIFEEPERYIHPHLIAKIVDMMKDVSSRKQVLVTTHSPEVVKHAGIENIYCIARNEKGFSVVNRPGDMENVKVFLKNDMGIDQLFVDNLLGN
jgi:predicted ATPase